jgi:hypothetical protein
MRSGFIALVGLTLLAACGEAEPHPYPAAAQTRFEASCPSTSAVCRCTWERITVAVTHEEYEAAMARFRAEGLMDPRLTRARTQCIERHPEEGRAPG